MQIKKVAIYPGYDNMLNDAIFDTNSEAWKELRGLPIYERYVALKEFLEKKGLELHTYDVYKTKKEIDLWLMLEVTPRNLIFFVVNFINPKKVIPVLLEPAIVNYFQWKYIGIWSKFYKTVLTWSPELALSDKKFIKYDYIPFAFDKSRCEKLRAKAKNNKCLLIQSNKASRVPGELYSLRREIIRYFEKNAPEFFDLYGRGWNTPHTEHLGPSEPFYTDVYKGEAGDKWETFADYKFVLCIQNAIPKGQFEGDAFMALAVGGVPIYLPPGDADQYIPQATYINYAKFKDMDELYNYLKNLSNEEYENYRKAGWEYLNSPKFKPFTVENFAENVYNTIKIHEFRI